MYLARRQVESASGGVRRMAVQQRPIGPEGEANEPDRQVVTIRLPAGEVARAVIVAIAVGLGAYLIWRLHEVLLLLLLAVLLATAIEPIVNRLRRGPFTRGTGVLIVYTTILIAIALPAYLVAPGLVVEGSTFVESIPDRLQALRPHADQIRPRVLQEAATGALDAASNQVANPAPPGGADLVEAGATAAHTVISFITVFVLAFYWLIERATIKRWLLRTVPHPWAHDVNAIWLDVEHRLGGWVRGQILVMATIALIAGVGFVTIGLPNPILLAVLAGLAEIIPLVGPFLAFAPAVLVAASIDPSKALIVLVFGIAVQQLENHVLIPRIMGHTVGISPLTVLLGILVGAALYGVPGAFIAVPVAGTIQVVIGHLLRRAHPDGSTLRPGNHQTTGERSPADAAEAPPVEAPAGAPH